MHQLSPACAHRPCAQRRATRPCRGPRACRLRVLRAPAPRALAACEPHTLQRPVRPACCRTPAALVCLRARACCAPPTSAARPQRLLRAPAPTCCSPSAPERSPALSWPGWPCRGLVSRHSPAAHCPCCQNTILCIATQFFPQPAFLPQYTRLYCDTVSALSSAIQTSVLQYTSSPS